MSSPPVTTVGSSDPERDEQMYSEKLELIKKQVQLGKMSREVQGLQATLAESKTSLEPFVAKIDALQAQVDELAATYESKLLTIAKIKGNSNVLTVTKDMSAVDVIEARKARAKLHKLEGETMELEIEILEVQLLVDAERKNSQGKVNEIQDTESKLDRLVAVMDGLKLDYEKSNALWISKYWEEDSTSKSTPKDDTTPTQLDLVSSEKAALKIKFIELSKDNAVLKSTKIRIENENRLLKEQNCDLIDAAAFAKVTAQAGDIGGLKAIIAAGIAENQEQAKEIESLKAQVIEAQQATDLKVLEEKIELMKPLYCLGRHVRYRNNYSLLRKLYDGWNMNIDFDKYELGYHAYFGGHALADAIMYYGGLDDVNVHGREEHIYEYLHHGISAKMVWEHREDFTMLAKILDMGANMKAYGNKNTNCEFGNPEFKSNYVTVINAIMPHFRTYAITTDEEFRKHPALVEAFTAMHHIAVDTAHNKYVDRRKGIEGSWEQPYENAWEEFSDVVYEANRRGMF